MKPIRTGEHITLTRGTPGQPGYQRQVRIADTNGNPNYPKHAISMNQIRWMENDGWKVEEP